MMVCPLPSSVKYQIPKSVSLVEKKCDRPTNNLKVIYNIPRPGEEKESFVVCSKQLSILEDLSLQIAEWFEILRVLGAKKLDLKTITNHKNIDKVLDYYHDLGFVEKSDITLPGPLPNILNLTHKYLYERIQNRESIEQLIYSDCLYRNMYKYQYIAVLGIKHPFHTSQKT